jgi:hypothetical protein
MLGLILLIPAWGVVLLVACCVGVVSMIAHVGYLMAYDVLGMIFGQGNTREVQRMVQEAKQRARAAS